MFMVNLLNVINKAESDLIVSGLGATTEPER